MKTARMFMAVYRLYRTRNPRAVAFRVAWRAARMGG